MKFISSEDNESVFISASWCINRSGICLSFAIPIDVLSIDELNDYSDEFVKVIKSTYKNLLKNFIAKSDTPLISATPSGEIIMIWSFQADESNELKKELKENKIMEIEYD